MEIHNAGMGYPLLDPYGNTAASGVDRNGETAAIRPKAADDGASGGDTISVSRDALLLTEIYAASEKPIPGVSGQSLADGIQQVCGTPMRYCRTLDDLRGALDAELKPGDVLLTLGAGSITRIGPAWLEGTTHA